MTPPTAELDELVSEPLYQRLLADVARARLASPLTLAHQLSVRPEVAESALTKLNTLQIVAPSSLAGSAPVFRMTAYGYEVLESLGLPQSGKSHGK